MVSSSAPVKTFVCLLVAILLVAVSKGEPPIPVTFTTLSGEKYENVRIVSRTPLELTVQTAAGIARVPFSALAPDVRAQLGYDHAKAVAYYNELVAARKQQAEAEQKQREDAAVANRARRQEKLDRLDAMDAAMREYQYEQETAGARRTEALKAAMREKYLQGGDPK